MRALPEPIVNQTKMTEQFKTAKCPDCGAAIQVPRNYDFARCSYCNHDVKVRESTSNNNFMQLASAAAEAGNSEEAYSYFTRALEADPDNYEAWYGKALAAGWTSTLANVRFAEVVSGVRRALELCPAENLTDLTENGAEAMTNIASAYDELSLNNMYAYVALDDSFWDHAEECSDVLELLDEANKLDPRSQYPLRIGVHITKRLLEGVVYDDIYNTDDDGFSTKCTHRLLPTQETSIRMKFNEYTQKLSALDPSYQQPQPQQSQISKATLPTNYIVIAALVFAVFLLVVWGSC